MISHQGSEKHGHYVAITKKGKEWILHNDASTTQTTPAHLHQSQAYVLIYRKTKLSTEMETGAPITGTSQQRTEKLKPHNSSKESLSHPDPPKNSHMENLPREERLGTGAHPNPTPTERPTIENLRAPEILLSNHYAPQALDIRGEVEIGGAIEPEGVDTPLTEKADRTEEPLPEEKGTGQPDNEHSNLPQSISTFLHLSQGRIEEQTSLLSELSGTPLTMEITTNC